MIDATCETTINLEKLRLSRDSAEFQSRPARLAIRLANSVPDARRRFNDPVSAHHHSRLELRIGVASRRRSDDRIASADSKVAICSQPATTPPLAGQAYFAIGSGRRLSADSAKSRPIQTSDSRGKFLIGAAIGDPAVCWIRNGDIDLDAPLERVSHARSLPVRLYGPSRLIDWAPPPPPTRPIRHTSGKQSQFIWACRRSLARSLVRSNFEATKPNISQLAVFEELTLKINGSRCQVKKKRFASAFAASERAKLNDRARTNTLAARVLLSFRKLTPDHEKRRRLLLNGADWLRPIGFDWILNSAKFFSSGASENHVPPPPPAKQSRSSAANRKSSIPAAGSQSK